MPTSLKTALAGRAFSVESIQSSCSIWSLLPSGLLNRAIGPEPDKTLTYMPLRIGDVIIKFLRRNTQRILTGFLWGSRNLGACLACRDYFAPNGNWE